MGRPDLLALTPDDLAVLANVGLLKRAQREVAGGGLTWELTEDAEGGVRARWSDGPECLLPAGVAPGRWRCDCPATGICRHLLRTVLAYQRGTAARTGGPVAPATPWDPGDIDDDALAALLPARSLAHARRAFGAGQVVELARGTKPLAQFHSLAVTIRFLVPGDARYTRCDCRDAAPCAHVPLAVWAFRLLEVGRTGGLVATRREGLPVPGAVLDEIEALLPELADIGLAHAPRSLLDRFRRLEGRCRVAGLPWPAEIVGDLLGEAARYAARDARFGPERPAELIGELLIRAAAIRNDTGVVPAPFVRGAAGDRAVEVGVTRLIGLGCGVRSAGRGVELAAYLHDTDTGAVVAVTREFAAPSPPGEDQAFWHLARGPIARGVTLGSLGSGQLLLNGAKRTSARRLLLGRAPLSATPQAFAWELLRAPTLAENFAELRARLGARPPAALRPRLLGDNFHVCAVAAASDAHFSAPHQAVTATLHDPSGGWAQLLHPYTTAGAAGCDLALAALADRPEDLRFVAGTVGLAAGELILRPVALVFETGGRRTMIQPWIDGPWAGAAAGVLQLADNAPGDPPADPVAAYPDDLLAALAELFLDGLGRADAQTVRSWRRLYEAGGALGFRRLLEPVARLADALGAKDDQLHWESRPAVEALLDLALLVRLLREELPPSGSEDGTP